MTTAIPAGAVTLHRKAFDLLRQWGWAPYLDVRSGWKTRSNGHKTPLVPDSIMFHHTGGTATSTDYLLNPKDRPQLKLLANIHIDQGDRRIRLLAAGPASHAGNGYKANYDRMLRGDAPLSGDMKPKAPDSSTFSANRPSVGVEVDGAGGSKEWNDWTKAAVLAVGLAFNLAGKWARDGKSPRVWSHKEFTTRKPGDPYANIGTLRAAIKELIEVDGVVTPAGAETSEPPVLGKRILSKDGTDRGADVTELIDLLNKHGYKLKNDGLFGPAVEAAVRDYQAKNGLDVDGKVGPFTATKLKGEKLPEPQPEPVPTPPKPTKAVIIVAGSANTTEGKISGKHVRRLKVALSLLNKTPSLRIVVTGGVKAGRGSKSEAALAKAWLIDQGIASNRIITESTSGSTYGNFQNGMPIAKKAGAESVIVISDFSHMRRCLAMAYAVNRAKGLDLPISGVAWYKDGSSQDASVSGAATQARVAWSGMTADRVQDLDGRWGVASFPIIRKGKRVKTRV